MSKKFFLSFSLVVACLLTFSMAYAKVTFVTIGTGGITGVYYPTGGAIAKMVNNKREEYNIRATVESTGGSVFNVNSVMSGDLEFGVVQSDRQYQAINGLAEWMEKGVQADLRAVFSIHPESVTLVAAVDSGIMDIRDLKGKRVNIGNPGSGQRQNSIDALKNGEGQITVHLGELSDGKHSVFIDIIDNGQGIDSTHRKNVFKPGYSTKKRGWGLGLSLAKRIIEEYHGGKLFLKESKTGQGTTMRILL